MSTTDRNKQLVLEAWDAFWRGDIDAGMSRLADDVVWIVPGNNRFAGTLAGKDAVRRFRFAARELFSEMEREVVGIYADGDTVVMESAVRARLRSGAPYENNGVLVLEMRDGLVQNVREYLDTARAMAIDDSAGE